MSLISRVGKGSSIYTITAFLQRGIGFFLLPLYTRYLTPDDYGILAVVTAINGFLSILFMLSLNGAINRFYFEYRENPALLQEFWGTVLTFILILSISFGVILLAIGEFLLKPAIGDIPFWPFVAMGVGAVIFQPFFNIYLSLLQTTEQSFAYGVYSIVQFLISVLLIISLVVFAGWGAEGPLAGTLFVAILFFLISFWGMRNQIKFGIKWKYLKEALRYSLPLVPHDLSGQLSSVVGRIFLNSMISTASAGLYNIGFAFGSMMVLITTSVNRAYVPVSMDVLTTKDPQQIDQLKKMGIALIVFYCLIGTAISLFSKEIIMIFTTKSFYESYPVVPFLTFAFVLHGIYYVLSNILFFIKSATRFVAIGTFTGSFMNIILSLFLIPILGLIGAAVSYLVAEGIMLLIVASIGHRYDIIKWPYFLIIIIFFISLLVSIGPIFLNYIGFYEMFTLKLLAMCLLFFLFNYLVWSDGLYLGRFFYQIVRKKLL